MRFALPESASFETGACLGIAGMTAHRCLFQDADPGTDRSSRAAAALSVTLAISSRNGAERASPPA